MGKQTVTGATAQKENAEKADQQAADQSQTGGEAAPAGNADPIGLPDEIKALIDARTNEQVVLVLKDMLPAIVQAQVLELLTGDDALKASGPTLEEVLTGVKAAMPDLIADYLPEARAAQEKAVADEAAAQAAMTAREQAAAQKAREEKAAEQLAKKRASAQADAVERFGDMFGSEAQTDGFTVAAMTEGTRQLATLLIDDGKGFCIDFYKLIDPAELVQVEDVVRLAIAVQLPADIPAFVVQGVTLSIDNAHAVRCEIPTPLHIGDGRSAMLAADSLVFRAPVRAAADA